VEPAIDAHQHFWNPARLRPPWLGPQHGILDAAFEPDDLEPLLTPAGVDRTVVVQSADLTADNELMLDYARAHMWVSAIVGWVPLESPLETAPRLDELAAEPLFRGVRHLLHEETDPHWLLRPAVLESLALLEARDLVFEIPAIFPRHLQDVPRVAAACPGLRIVVDHLGKPPLDGEGFDDWARQLRAAAGAPNVLAKISGLNTATSSTSWTSADLAPAVDVALECFGPSRLLCGSDWPVALLNGDYPRVWQATRELLAPLSEGERSAILTGTAERLYGLAAEA
jgi:L-fuconolactonase